jgi:hypothetical protein
MVWSTALRGKKQNKASLSGSNFRYLHVKKALFGEKNHALLSLLKNQKCISYYQYSTMDRDISKIPTVLDSAG